MLSFTNPWFLLLLLLVPLVGWAWVRRRRPALRYSNTGLLAELPPGKSRLAHGMGVGVRLAALVALILGLAGLRWPDYRTRIPTEGIAIEMVVDVSGSMAEKDFLWEGQKISRLDAVKKAFELFVAGGDVPGGVRLEGRPGDLIGLVTFASRPTSVSPLTLSHSVLLQLMSEEEPRSIPGESQTNISDAVVLGAEHLQQAGPRRKVMVLLSDGVNTVNDPRSGWTSLQAAQIAANLDSPVRVYVIDAGGVVTAPPDAVASRAEGIRRLQQIAKLTAGQYFKASDTDSLLDVCRQIDSLEREQIRSFLYRRYHEAFPWLGLAAFAMWITIHCLEMTVWRSLP